MQKPLMKPRHVLLACSTIGLLIMVSCTKEDKKTTDEKIQGKWQVESVVDHEHVSGLDSTDTYTGTPNDYLDFHANGKLYYSWDGDTDSVGYTLQDDTKILFDEGIGEFDIQTLTENTLKLYAKDSIYVMNPG